jgi:hypothetical protein
MRTASASPSGRRKNILECGAVPALSRPMCCRRRCMRGVGAASLRAADGPRLQGPRLPWRHAAGTRGSGWTAIGARVGATMASPGGGLPIEAGTPTLCRSTRTPPLSHRRSSCSKHRRFPPFCLPPGSGTTATTRRATILTLLSAMGSGVRYPRPYQDESSHGVLEDHDDRPRRASAA